MMAYYKKGCEIQSKCSESNVPSDTNSAHEGTVCIYKPKNGSLFRVDQDIGNSTAPAFEGHAVHVNIHTFASAHSCCKP